ncbi:nacht and tpr domain-containing [Fusarium sporotrichioides]|uniref:Nacht and tpr domain-containing n=1 Tax=Fusarium sporotrichioides TaxID=5514 RepID=A0A395SU75_FUSSP|nr:nacht and tpr domain-containing [Fusarium sporotrichioides]
MDTQMRRRDSDEEEDDGQAIARLWEEALKGYKGVAGRDLKQRFVDTQAMIDQATNDMENFHKYRHNEKKVDKLRSILIENLEYIEAGTQQLANAASSAFPPAAAIGVALTYFMEACRTVSADYDTVTIFFEDMKSFLHRITILEARLPKSRHYRVCLLDVFASFLVMCGLAQKFVELGRFTLSEKWISNLLGGEDSELASARKDMDMKLSRLQNATENAILGNTEELLKMTQELQKNGTHHKEVLQEQLETMRSLRDTTERMSEDLAKLIKAVDEQRRKGENDQGVTSQLDENEPVTATRIRNMLPAVQDEGLEYRILKETLVPDTCSWVFSETQWRQWWKQTAQRPSTLAIVGPAGLGKSHITATIYDKLKKEVQKDSSKTSCVAQFYFREHNPHLSNFLLAISSVINQVARQSSSVCGLLNDEWQNDEIVIRTSYWQDLVRLLLIPAFKKNSQNLLFVIFDGMDELGDLTAFTEFTEILQEEEANISLVLTFRPDTLPEMAGVNNILTIHASMQKLAPDLRALIWTRLNSLGALKTFSRYVQQRIADRVETTAPNMLYAENILHQLDALGREGAVLRNLDQPLPKDLPDLYHGMLLECYRRTAATYHNVVTNLLYWVAYSFRPLTLSEVTSLAKLWAGDALFDLDDIPEPFAKFVRIGDLGADAEGRAKLQAQEAWGKEVTELEAMKGAHQPNSVFDDGGLLIKFRERSLRSFFRDPPKKDSPHLLTPSQACYRIFLDCASIVRSSLPQGIEHVKSIQSFGVEYLLEYWKMIKLEEHSVTEQAEAMEAFATVMLNTDEFATMVESQEGETYYTKRFSDDVFMQLSHWANFLRISEIKLSNQACQWWEGLVESPRKCLWYLSKAHARNTFNSKDLVNTKASFNAFKDSFQASRMNYFLVKDPEGNSSSAPVEQEEPLSSSAIAHGLEGLFADVELGASGYRALASLLFDFKETGSAGVMCRKAIDKAQDTEERIKIYELMARIHLDTDLESAYNYINSYFEDTVQSGEVSSGLKRCTLITKARIEALMENQDQAAKLYQQARTMDPTFVTTENILSEEIKIFVKNRDKSQVLNRLMEWRPLERLAWIASGSSSGLLQDVAVATGQVEQVIKIYEEAIKYLDNVQAGAPIRINLGFFYLMVCDDAQKTREMTDEVLDSRCNTVRYAVTGEYSDYTLESAIELQSQANNILFRDSNDPTVMTELVKAQEGLLTRPLALDVPPQSETYMFQRHLTLSRMYRKMGPAVQFERYLQGMIDTCIQRLGDKVGWNDSDSLVQLATTLNDLSQVVQNGKELNRMAKILISAQFSVLVAPEEEKAQEIAEEAEESSRPGEDQSNCSSEPLDEGDLADADDVQRWCSGICEPKVEFTRWGSSVGYQCLTCYFCILCEECYDRLSHTSSQGTRREYPKYCEKQFGHIKAPIEGWRGVRNGSIMIEGEEPLPFDRLLQHIQDDLCKEAWKDFWRN